MTVSATDFAPMMLYGFFVGYEKTASGYSAVLGKGLCRDHADTTNMSMMEPYSIEMIDQPMVVLNAFAFAGEDGAITRIELMPTDETPADKPGEVWRKVGWVTPNHDYIRRGLAHHAEVLAALAEKAE